jgi:hypothetical protein
VAIALEASLGWRISQAGAELEEPLLVRRTLLFTVVCNTEYSNAIVDVLSVLTMRGDKTEDNIVPSS